MKKILISLSLLATMISCNAQKEDNTPDKTVKIQSADGIPVIRIKINGKEVYVIMDTGASISVIDENASSELEFSVRDDPREQETAGYGGNTTMMLTDITGFELDGEELRGEFKTQDLSNVVSAMRSGTGYRITAIVGMNFMRKYDFAFNFQDNVLTFNND